MARGEEKISNNTEMLSTIQINNDMTKYENILFMK